MVAKVKCPGCGKIYEVPRESLASGIKIQCNQCGKQFGARIRKTEQPSGPPSSPSFLKGKDQGSSPSALLGLEEDPFGESIDLLGKGEEKTSGKSPGSSLLEDPDPFAPSPSLSARDSTSFKDLFEESDPKKESSSRGQVSAPSVKKPKAPDFDWEEPPLPEEKEARTTGSSSSTTRTADSPLTPRIRFTPGLQETDLRKVLSQTVKPPEEEPRFLWHRYFFWGVLFVLLVIAGVVIVQGGFLPKDFLALFHPRSNEDQPSLAPFTLAGELSLQRLRHRLGYEILVVTGSMKNLDSYPQSFLALKVILKRSSGEEVSESIVYAGNLLSEGELTTLPRARVEEILRTETGQHLANFNIPPQGQVPFMAVFFDPPQGEVRVEIFPIKSQRGVR